MTLRLTGRVLVLAAVAAWTRTSAALDAEQVELQVHAIRATTKNNEISKELKEIAEQLKKTFKYTGYKLEKTSGGKTEVDKAWSGDLTGRYRVEVTPTERRDSQAQLRVVIFRTVDGKERKEATQTFRVERGKFQLIGGDKFKLEGGDDLIIAVGWR
jgi:hypothetical protein